MKNTLHNQFKDARPIMVHPLSTWFGVAVYENDGDKVVSAWHNGNEKYGFRHEKICYAANDRAYFRKNGIRVYLDECI